MNLVKITSQYKPFAAQYMPFIQHYPEVKFAHILKCVVQNYLQAWDRGTTRKQTIKVKKNRPKGTKKQAKTGSLTPKKQEKV